MSDDLYRVRLRWEPGGGIAKRGSLIVRLPSAPDLGDGPVHELEYSPGIGVREVRPRCIDERRDMTLAEEARAVALLREMCPSQWGDLVT